MNNRCSTPWCALALLCAALLPAAPALAQSRGELLYSTHCITCHTAQMHWRDNKAATHWAGLKAQVRRWQNAASLQWSDADILDVTRYLNDTIYHFEQTAEPLSSSVWPVAHGGE
jgi:mono/diheme cytochrome c family protein